MHPAFTFGEELTGIWVAKFEASKNETDENKIAILPNVLSWGYITIGDSFTNSLNMNLSEDNIYQISTSDSEIDSHLMLNSEWGAVAYLTQSSYGRNGTEVTINAVYEIIDETQYPITGGSLEEDAYILNVSQSTTGNVTGIYDMNGGAVERTAAYFDNASSNLNM